MPYAKRYRKCGFPDCGRPHAAHDLCHGHLKQLQRGQVLRPLEPRQPRGLTLDQVVERLLAKAVPSGDCLLLHQRNDRDGYAHASFQGEGHKAHRLVLTAAVGPPPEGKPLALHSCHRPACVNAEHLRWGDDADNMADAMAAGRHAVGERNGTAKLTEEDVRAIKQLREDGLLQREVAALYGVARSRISHIERGYDWRHVH